MKFSLLYLLFTILFLQCKAQTGDEKIRETSILAIKMITECDTTSFINLIGSDLEGIKNDRMIKGEVKLMQRRIQQFLGNHEPSIEVTNLYNEIGQRLVRIPLYKGTNDTIPYNSLHISFVFGPKEYVSLNKLAGYRIVTNNYDSSFFHPIEYWQR